MPKIYLLAAALFAVVAVGSLLARGRRAPKPDSVPQDVLERIRGEYH